MEETSANSKNESVMVCIMPWAGLKRELQIGKIRFLPRDHIKTKNIGIQNLLTDYFKGFVDDHGNPVNTIAICSYEGKAFIDLCEDQWQQMRFARNALVFSVICPQVLLSIRGNSTGLCSAERFYVIGQRLCIGHRNIYIKAGYNLKIGQMGYTKISKPQQVADKSMAQPNEELMQGFDRLASNVSFTDLQRRLFQSLEWFRLAHVEADQVSELSKIVMMATAFEVLLNLSVSDKSIDFAQKVEKWLASQDSIKETLKHGRTS